MILYKEQVDKSNEALAWKLLEILLSLHSIVFFYGMYRYVK